jgi:TetR/AcrR family transcriptional regulator
LLKPKTSKVKAAENRQAILVNAIPLFADNGCAAVSIRDIAGAAGVNIPTIYHHFGDKLGLYQECCSVVFLDANATLLESIREELPAEENVIAFVAALYTMLSDATNLSKLFLRELADRDEAGLSKLTEESFFTAFDKLYVVVGSLLEKTPNRRQIISVFALTFGLAQMSHMRPALQRGDDDLVMVSPREAAEFILATMLPAMKER